jgi:hypothetical protein
VLTTLLLIPVNTVVGKRLGKMRREMLQFTDKRVKLVTEVITGVKAVSKALFTTLLYCTLHGRTLTTKSLYKLHCM